MDKENGNVLYFWVGKGRNAMNDLFKNLVHASSKSSHIASTIPEAYRREEFPFDLLYSEYDTVNSPQKKHGVTRLYRYFEYWRYAWHIRHLIRQYNCFGCLNYVQRFWNEVRKSCGDIDSNLFMTVKIRVKVWLLNINLLVPLWKWKYMLKKYLRG